MFTRITNDKGALSFSKNLIDQIIRDAFAPWKSKCWPAKYAPVKTEAVFRFFMLDAPGVKEMSYSDNGVFIKIYVIIKLGEPIKSTLENIISSIKKDIEQVLELKVDNIIIIVSAVAATRNFASRNISLDCYGNYVNACDEVENER